MQLSSISSPNNSLISTLNSSEEISLIEQELSNDEFFKPKFNSYQRCFKALINIGVFDEDSNFIKDVTSPLPALPLTILKLLFEELKSLHLIDLFMHLASKTSIYPLNSEELFRIVGSWVFWRLGKEYTKEVLSHLGLSIEEYFSKDQLDELFVKPADLDIRINMPDASHEQLKKMGLAIQDFFQTNNIKVTIKGVKRKPVDTGMNIIHIINLSINNIKIDLTLVSKLNRQFLFGEDDLYLPFSEKILEQIKNGENISEVNIYPQGSLHRGWHAIPLRMTKNKWVENVNSIDVRGSLKFLLSFIKGATCFSSKFEKKLFDNFLSILTRPEGPEEAIKLLHNAVNNHMPNQPAAFTGFCFNISFLLEFYRPMNWENSARLLFNELKTKTKSEESAIPKQNIAALEELLKNQLVPFEILSSFLLIQAILLELRKEHFNQKNSISAFAALNGGREITQLFLSSEKIYLILPANLKQAIQALNEYFQKVALAEGTLRELQFLMLPFYQNIKPVFNAVSTNLNFSSSDITAAKEIAKITLEMHEHKILRPIAFCLLSFCGEILMTSSFCGELIKWFPQIIQENEHPGIRLSVFQHLMRYYLRVKPSCPIFQNKEKIESFENLLQNSTTSKEEALKSFCKVFACGPDYEIGVAVQQAWKGLFESKTIKLLPYIKLGREIIDAYLSGQSKAPFSALSIIIALAKSPQVQIKDFDDKFYKTMNLLANHTLSPSELLICLEAAKLLISKLSINAKMNGNDIHFFNLVLALKKDFLLESLKLFELADGKKVLENKQKACELHIDLAKDLFSQKMFSEALVQWQKGYAILSIESNLLQLLSWRQSILKQSSINFPLWKDFLGLILPCCSDQLPTNLKIKLIEAIADLLKEMSLPKPQAIGRIKPYGKWLFFQLNLLQESCNLNIPLARQYFDLLKACQIEMSTTSEASNFVSAFCFIETLNPDEGLPEVKISELGHELLKASSHDMQLAGFLIVSQIMSTEPKLDTLVLAFSNLCTEEKDPKIRQILFERLYPFFPLDSIDLSSKSLILTLLSDINSSSEQILEAICISFIKAGLPSGFDIALEACKKLNSKELTRDLIKSFFQDYPILSDRALKSFPSRYFQSEEWLDLFNMIFQSNQNLSEHHIHLLLKMLDNGKAQLKDKITIISNFFLLIDQLLSHNISNCFESYEHILDHELKNIMPLGTKEKLFRYYLSKDSFEKALKFWESYIAKEISEDMLMSLLDGKFTSNNHFKCQLVLSLCQDSFPDKMVATLVKAANETLIFADTKPSISHFNECLDWLVGKLSDDLLDPELLKKFVSWKVDVLDLIERHNLFSIITNIIDIAFHYSEPPPEWLFDTFINSKKKGHGHILTLLAKSLLEHSLDKSFACLMKSFEDIELVNSTDIDTYFSCIKKLLSEEDTRRSIILLSSIKSYMPTIEQESQAEAWFEVFLKLPPETSQSGKILIDQFDLFKKFKQIKNLNENAKKICTAYLQGKRDDRQMQALKIAELYEISNATFWKLALSHLNPGSEAESKIYSSLAQWDNPFFGDEKDCCDCWHLYIKGLARQPIQLSRRYLKNWKNLLNIFSENEDQQADILCNLLDLSLKFLNFLSHEELQEAIINIEELQARLKWLIPEQDYYSLMLTQIEKMLIKEDSWLFHEALLRMREIYSTLFENQRNSFRKLVCLAIKYLPNSNPEIQNHSCKLINEFILNTWEETDLEEKISYLGITAKTKKNITFKAISKNFIIEILDHIHDSPQGQSIITNKRILAGIIHDFLESLQGESTSISLQYDILTHPKIFMFLTESELSKNWAELQLCQINLCEENEGELLFTLEVFSQYVSFLTCNGDSERACFRAVSMKLVQLYAQYNYDDQKNDIWVCNYYKLIFKISKQLLLANSLGHSRDKDKFKKGNLDLPFSYHKFCNPFLASNNAFILECLKTCSNLSNNQENYLSLIQGAYEDQAISDRYYLFFEEFIGILILCTSESLHIKGFLEANIYFHISILMSFEPGNPELIFLLIRQLYFSKENHLNIASDLFDKAYKIFGKKLSSNIKLDYYYMLFATGQFQRAIEESKEINVTCGSAFLLIENYCKQSQPLIGRALLLLSKIQEPLLVNYPKTIKNCYHAVVMAMWKDPKLIETQKVLLGDTFEPLPIALIKLIVTCDYKQNVEVEKVFAQQLYDFMNLQMDYYFNESTNEQIIISLENQLKLIGEASFIKKECYKAIIPSLKNKLMILRKNL